MWWFGCSNVSGIFFGPIIMMAVFMAACMAMMLFMMRRHGQPGGHGAMLHFNAPFSSWRDIESTAARGNQTSTAFEEYREQTLKRLEDEQIAFRSFLERLRLAKDRAEFDQFMTQQKSA